MCETHAITVIEVGIEIYVKKLNNVDMSGSYSSVITVSLHFIIFGGTKTNTFRI